MNGVVKRIISAPLQIWASLYFKKPRSYRFKKIKGVVLPSVFFPHLTISTKLLMEFLEKKDLAQKTFLELGCGTGFISVLAAKKEAKVCASDINPIAVDNVRLNALKNQVYVNGVQSDLFENLPKLKFDWIVINPPYYPKSPSNDSEKAWYCGKDFEYFKILFKGLRGYFSNTSTVLMILSEDCEIDKIINLAIENQLTFTLVQKKKKWGERNYIFQIH